MTFAEMAAIMDRDHPSAEQFAAEDAADGKLSAEYPGRYVAYRDHWDGACLRRDVLASAAGLREFHAALGMTGQSALPDVNVVFIPADPSGVRVAPWAGGPAFAAGDTARAG